MTTIRIILAGMVVLLAGLPAIAQTDDKELLKQAQALFQPLPKDMATPEVPITRERVALGRLLFFDPRFSIDGNVGCVTCHQPALYGTDGRSRSIGVKSRPHPRHAPSVLNAALQFVIHWRGDRVDAEDQVVQSLLSPITSGQPDETALLARVNSFPGLRSPVQVGLSCRSGAGQPQEHGACYRCLRANPGEPSFDGFLRADVHPLAGGERAGLAKFMTSARRLRRRHRGRRRDA